ncbi:DNA repair protein rad52 [Gryganskiella cystojenkinii]|nr:DNA repair protein rad52 [Gryganskiella cystojenkinii]
MENLKILKTEPSLVRPNPAANGSVDNVVNDPVIFGRGPNANMVNPYALPPPPALPARTNVGFTPEERARLEIDLPKYIAPEFTSTRSGPGQTTLNYIEGWRIKNLANKLFGFNGWNHSISDVTVDFLDVDRDGKVSVGVSVMVRVTLKDGTYHEDMGYGSSENQKSKASSFEKARKEAVTDALKRALTSFGNVLGTCLYDKNYCKYLRQQRFNPLFGLDFDGGRPLQPESPRMSDFDDIDMGAMGEMMADDSPVKPKTNGAVGGIPNPFNTNNVPAPPATLKRQGTFSRSTSSPSLSSPTKSAGPPQAFQGQETALITNVKPTSLYSPAINPFIVRNPTPTASSFTANGNLSSKRKQQWGVWSNRVIFVYNSPEWRRSSIQIEYFVEPLQSRSSSKQWS